MPVDELSVVLHELADIADSLALPPWQNGDLEASTKDDGTIVTQIDAAVERAVRARVQETRPGDGFLGEEVGASAGSTNRTWIVDGIDGTKFYARGDQAWSTMIALTVRDLPVAGIVTSPSLGRRWWVGEDGPWTRAGRAAPTRLRVTEQASTDDAVIAVWPWEGQPRPAFRQRWTRFGVGPDQDRLRPSASTGVPTGALLVAEGQADGFVHFGGQAWDHAATVAIITAAGGRFTCLDGTDSISTGAGVYSNGLIHDALLERLAQADTG